MIVTVEQPLRVDIVAKGDEGEVLLVMVEYREWSEIALMKEQFKRKLQNYLYFAYSPDFYESYGNKRAIVQYSYAGDSPVPDEMKQFIGVESKKAGIQVRIEDMKK
jgi:hypothetical protein